MNNTFQLEQCWQPGKHALSLALATLMMLNSAPAWSAQTSASATAASANEDTAAHTLKNEITSAINDNAVSVTVTSSLHQISLDVINSRQNNATPALRKKDAVKLASVLENLIAGKKIYSDVSALHLNYIRIDEGHEKAVQSFDFIQTPAGVFVLKRN